MTKTDQLFLSLKLLGIETLPGDSTGRLAYYDQDHYLGTFNVEEGLEHIKKYYKLIVE